MRWNRVVTVYQTLKSPSRQSLATSTTSHERKPTGNRKPYSKPSSTYHRCSSGSTELLRQKTFEFSTRVNPNSMMTIATPRTTFFNDLFLSNKKLLIKMLWTRSIYLKRWLKIISYLNVVIETQAVIAVQSVIFECLKSISKDLHYKFSLIANIIGDI